MYWLNFSSEQGFSGEELELQIGGFKSLIYWSDTSYIAELAEKKQSQADCNMHKNL